MNFLLLNSLFQDATPDTSAYMVAGYAVFFVIMLIYLASLAIRQRNFKKDAELLEDLDDKNRS